VVLEAIEFPTPVVSVAIEARTQADQERLAATLAKIAAEDPSLQVGQDEESGQLILSGMGELHLEVIADRLVREFKVPVAVGRPRVAYRETIRSAAEGEGSFARQVGGQEQHGHVVLRLAPGNPEDGCVFENRAAPDDVPQAFVAAVEKGVREVLDRGALTGHPMIGVRATLLGGSCREESSEAAFKVAATAATRDAILRAAPVVLEPLMEVEVLVPEEFLGDVIGDLRARKARIRETGERGGTRVVLAECPLSALFGYATALRSRTQGRATFGMVFCRYRETARPGGREAAAAAG
jgi:elongation factor G